jgi:hypothetical protein
MATTKVTTPDGKVFNVTHKEGATKGQITDYINNVAYPTEALKEKGAFDFSIDALALTGGRAIQGTSGAVEGIQKQVGNALRNSINYFHDNIRAQAAVFGKLDGKTDAELAAARDKQLRGVDVYEELGRDKLSPIQKAGEAIENSRYLEQDTASANFALDVLGTIGYFSPVVASAFATRGVGLPTLLTVGQSTTEAVEDMERTLGKEVFDFTQEEKNDLAGVSTIYGLTSAVLAQLPFRAFGFGKLSPDTFRKFLQGKVKVPAKPLYNTLKAGAAEMLEESGQKALLDSLAKFSYDDDRELVGREALNEYKHQAAVAFFAGGAIRGGGEVMQAIGGIKVPTPERKALSEDKRANVKPFTVNYVTIEQEVGREDNVVDQETVVYAENLQEAEKIANKTLEKLPNIDKSSLKISEFVEQKVEEDPMLTEEPPMGTETEVQEDVDFIPDYSNAKVGDTIKVFGVNGKESDVEVIGVSDSGTIRFRRKDGSEGIIGLETDSVLFNINSTNYTTQAKGTGFGGRKISDMTDAELKELANIIDEKFKSKKVPKDGKEGGSREHLADRNAIKKEQNRRKQKPIDTTTKLGKKAAELRAKRKQMEADAVDPQQTGAEIPIGVFGAVDLDQVEGLTPQQKKKIEEIREEARQEANKLLIALADPTGTLDEQAVKEGLEALDDPTGAVDTKAVEEGLKALREISEEGTVGARKIDPKTIETFDKIREMERRQAEVFREEYVPSTNEQLLRRLELTIIDRGPRTTSGSIRLNIVGARKIPAVDKIDTVIDSPTVVPTDPSAGGRVRSIAKKYQLPENEVLDFTDDGTIDEGAKRIEAVLEKAFARFPKFEAWYSTRLKMAFDILTKLDPDLAKAEDSFVMKVLLAITSNGNEVSPQTQESYRIYQNWKNTGSIAVDSTQGTRQDALLGHLVAFNKLLQKHGFEKMKSFMDKSGTVKELRKELVDNFGFTIKEAVSVTAGENVDTEVPFAFILGPKLGSFYNNLNGNFDTTTMDRWFMRTFGRTMGTQLLKVSGFQQKVDRFLSSIKNLKGDPFLDRPIGKKDTRPIKDLLPKGKKVDISDLKKLSIWFGKKENRAGIIKGSAIDEFRKALNNLHKSGDGFDLLEAPKNGSHRVYIRKVMDKALTSFNSNNNVNFTPAEAQALLWYYEKLVHESNGSRQKDEAPDYATAAERVYRNETGRESGRYVLSDAIRSRGEVSRSDDVVYQEERPGQVQTVTDTTVGARPIQTDQQRGVIGNAINQTQVVAEKIGVKVEARNDIDRPAQYNYETQTIQYNPEILAQGGKDVAEAVMREEVIHSAMHKVIMKRFPKLSAKASFQKAMSDIGSALDEEQKTLLRQAYGDLESDVDLGAEYSRFAVQHIFDGKTTEGTMFRGKAYQKIKSLIRSVQSYLTNIMGPELKTNKDAAFIIADTVRLLKAVDPDRKPVHQKFVNQAAAVLAGTAEVDSYVFTEPFISSEEEIKRENDRVRRNRARIFQTASSFFERIHPKIRRLISNHYDFIMRAEENAFRTINNFQTGIKGIKNKSDKSKIKKLLLSTINPNTEKGQKLIKERDTLLLKYNLLNDFNLLVRPLLDRLRINGISSGLDIKYLFEYFPRRVKDLDGLLNFYGKDIRNDFNTRIESLNAERKADNKLELNKDEIQAEFLEYWRTQQYLQASKVPGFLQKRTADNLSEKELSFYEEPEVALGQYVSSLIVKTAESRLLGSSALKNVKMDNLDGQSIGRISLADPNGELSALVAELYSNGELDRSKMGDLFFGLDQMFGPAKNKSENEFAEIGRIASYGTLLVDPTTTLSQLYDLAFISLDNNVARVIKTIFSKKDFTLEMAGIDPTMMSAEFQSKPEGKRKFLRRVSQFQQNIVKKGLRLSQFTRMDQLMKETNLTANYNRFKRLAKLSENNSDFKKLKTELEFMVGEDANRVIADLRNNVHNSPYVREVVVRKLLETQPVTKFEMPMAVANDPNMRMWYTMKSFVIKQLNLVNDRMIQKLRRGSIREKKKAIADLATLLLFFLMAGIPIDFLKDMIAGRSVYPEDYVENAFWRLFGMSKYNLYIAREKGIADAIGNYFAPVPLAQVVGIINEATGFSFRKLSGEEDTGGRVSAEILKYIPFNDVWYYRYGPGAESQQKRFTRERKEKSRLPMIESGEPIDVDEIRDIIPYLRNL